jgi:hypothetical protein
MLSHSGLEATIEGENERFSEKKDFPKNKIKNLGEGDGQFPFARGFEALPV